MTESKNSNRLSSLTDTVSTGAIGAILTTITVAFLLSDLFITIPSSGFLYIQLLITWAVYGFLILGLNLQFGYTGIINFGHLFFFLVGGYTFAILTGGEQAVGTAFGLPWVIGVLAAAIVSALFGLFIGSFSLRLRGDFLAIVTLAALEVGLNLVGSFHEITGGENGLYRLPQITADFSGNADTMMVTTLLLFAGLLLMTYATVQRLSDAPYGRVLRAIRADELVARALGKNTSNYKLQVFVLGSALAGFAGVLIAMYNGSVEPSIFGLNTTIIIWLGLLLGGAGNHRAALAGVGIIMLIELLTRNLNTMFGSYVDVPFGPIRFIIIGLILVVVIRYRPAGIWGDEKEMTVHQ